eukprot:CAMPEP_0181113522 /NCGR_PEP_ID=MMETSP1071-20121207/20392_1 /TAXON_ID=35127 /ORGANISM="Thalassiosira sp., Strain NH16" /LENGTH=516 /DNA_ID=CAMNT_0023197565 /DNA_START=216 /DNA_END=1763 /DNA_ORIENTATION=-
MSSKPQDRGVDDSIDNDLKFLREMNIDNDFNAWSEFRSSIAVRGKSGESLDSFVSRGLSKKSIGNTDHSSTSTSTTPNKFLMSEKSITESNLGEDSEPHTDNVQQLDVSFSTLTPGEMRDIRAWNIRMARETVFSRYYFPEQWEIREMKTLEKFLEVGNSHEAPALMNETGHERTKKAIAGIFYPGDHDAKSVLLKRGPILLDGTNEKEMMLFTHGFMLSNMEFSSLLNIIFTINSENPHYLNSQKLRERFDAIDTDGSGSLDRCELKEVFKGMGVPISENALSDIMDRFDFDHDGTIDFDEFESVMHEMKPKKKELWSWGSLGSKVKDTLKMSACVEQKVDCGFLLSDIKKVESINVCYSEETQMFVNSSWAELVFAIFVKGRDDPLIMVCSKPEHRLAWVDAFRTCCVNSIQLRANSGSRSATKIQGKVGWQHVLIQASLFSLVVCNDMVVLKERLSSPSPNNGIDDQDEYCGCTALHYAAITGNIGCANLLLKHKARVNLLDDNQKTALDHGE